MRTDHRGLLGCAALLFASAAPAQLRVAATTGDMGALARAVGGDRVSVRVLALPTRDPHFIDASPSLTVELARADLLIVQGAGMEIGWLPALLASARNGSVQPGAEGHLDCSGVVQLLEVPAARVDRSMGDVHPDGNPHYTKDPVRGLRCAEAIAARLAVLDPPGAPGYRERFEALKARLGKRSAEWKRIAGLRGLPVVTYHRSWIYLTEWLGLRTVAHAEPKPGLPPSAQHIARVRRTMAEQKVRLILQEDWYPSNTTQLLARTTGARLIILPGMARANESYEAHLERLIEALTAGDAP